MNDELLESNDSGIATLTMNRPLARNALTPQMMTGLRESLPRLAADTNVPVSYTHLTLPTILLV